MKRLLFMSIMIFLLTTMCSITRSFELLENGPEHIPGEIIVKFKEATPEHTRMSILQVLGALEIRESYNSIFTAVRVPEGLIKTVSRALAKYPAVEYVQPNYVYRAHVFSGIGYGSPDDPRYIDQWHFRMINLEEAWELSTGDGVVVAVLDSGVHPRGKDGFGNRLLRGYNAFLNVEAFWQDNNYHGTHVAGTIAQETGNGEGVAGIAFDAEILPVKVLNRRLIGTTDLAASGIHWAADNGADIINMSFGAEDLSEESDRVLKEAIDYAYNLDVTLFASSGNKGCCKIYGPAVNYPARYENVIAVGAVDFRHEHVCYSDGGPNLDIVAPGGDTDLPGRGILQETFSPYLGFIGFALGWDYYYKMGTSMACPHASGVAALVKSIHPDWGPDEIKGAITETAVDLGPEGKDDFYGYGLLDAGAAVSY